MKLSEDTREVLKNFSQINPNLLVKNGSKIATMSAMKNIVALSNVSDNFSQEFAIYDLNEFLSALSLFKEPDLTFSNDSVKLKEQNGNSSLNYYFSDPTIVTAPKTQITMPSVAVEFVLTESIFAQIQKAAAVLNVPDLVLQGTQGSDINLLITDRKNKSSNDFSIKVGENAESDFSYNFKVENLKLLSGDYDVKVSDKGISNFKHKKKDIEYFIALETN